MRLTPKEIDIIKDSVDKIFGKSTIYLFGSRLDNSKKGGDIDLYIELEDKENLFELQRRYTFLITVKDELEKILSALL